MNTATPIAISARTVVRSSDCCGWDRTGVVTHAAVQDTCASGVSLSWGVPTVSWPRLAGAGIATRPGASVLRDNAPMSGTPLSPEDEAILQLEGPRLVGHTCKIIRFEGGRPSPAELRVRIAERMPDVPALSLRLSDEAGHMTWIADPDFDPRAHVVEGRPPRPLKREELRREVARLFAEHLDRARPLWRIDVLPLEQNGVALVWRLHHALADGATAMRYASALLWDEHPFAAARTPRGDVQARDEQRRRAHLARFFAREFDRARSPFDGRIGSRREVAFARLPLERLHAAAKQLAGATVNDAVVSAVGGGLSAWLERH